MLVFYAYPLYRNIDLSLRNYTIRSFINGNASFIGFQNYVTAFHNPTFWPAFIHTFVFTIVSLIFQFSIGLALAVFFIRRFPLSTTLRALFLIPWLLPLIVSASTWSWMFNSDSGVINSALSWFGIGPVNWLTSPQWALISVIIANIWIGVPFNLVVLYSGLQNIPADVYEAASLDGATGWKAFWRITFPLLRPVSAITVLLGFVYTLKVFDIIWIMTKGGPGDASTTLATWSYRLGFGTLVPEIRARRRGRQHADRHRRGLRIHLPPRAAKPGGSMTATTSSPPSPNTIRPSAGPGTAAARTAAGTPSSASS